MTALGRSCALAALAAALLAPTIAAAQAMQAGLWEITTRVEMAGMPMPPMTTTQCYRDAKPESIIPKQQNCSVQQQGAAGNTLRWTLRCQEGSTLMTGQGEMTLRGSSYDGVSQITVKDGTDETHMTHRYSGRRLGDC